MEVNVSKTVNPWDNVIDIRKKIEQGCADMYVGQGGLTPSLMVLGTQSARDLIECLQSIWVNVIGPMPNRLEDLHNITYNSCTGPLKILVADHLPEDYFELFGNKRGF